ncbi:MAG: VOC family protein [Chloroflexi bacterium]|nr:VOC family protein [Chloroflexota bacterium]MQC26360.1 VOC family protein [Chloroflexota bacterium]
MELNQVRLLVDHFDECKAFYRDLLGLEMTVDTEENVYAQFIAEGVALGLYRRDLMANVVGRNKASDERGGKDTALLVFAVEDVDAAFTALTAKGADFVSEPHDQEAWFMRVAHLRDPDGNLIEIYTSTYTGEES